MSRLSAPRRALYAVVVTAVATVTASCEPVTSSDNAPSGSEAAGGGVEKLVPEIVAQHPFDKTAFTQGLEVDRDGSLVVGTGMHGQSRVYRTTVDGAQRDIQPLDAQYFGEGIAIHGDTVWQLTWKNGTAFRRDAHDLTQVTTAHYDSEGWGLCSDGKRLVMSDGSSSLTFRDPETFAEIGRVDVTAQSKPVQRLNELDCAPDGSVWANIWQTNEIARIDPATGQVTALVDTTGVFEAAHKPGADVLNGIAHIPGTDRYFVTGKYWDTLYEVRFRPAVS